VRPTSFKRCVVVVAMGRKPRIVVDRVSESRERDGQLQYQISQLRLTVANRECATRLLTIKRNREVAVGPARITDRHRLRIAAEIGVPTRCSHTTHDTAVPSRVRHQARRCAWLTVDPSRCPKALNGMDPYPFTLPEH
jgi:hypothetical protein